MKYRVSLTHEAQRQLFETALWWSENRDAEQAEAWLNGFEVAIQSLADEPERCTLAEESKELRKPLHQLLYGLKQKKTHRAVFRIRGDLVEVIAIRHLSQDYISLEW